MEFGIGFRKDLLALPMGRNRSFMTNLQKKILVFEGPNDVGKTTLSLGLSKVLKELAVDAELFSFPGKNCSELGDLVYKLHSDANAGTFEIESFSLQMLHVAAHIDLIKNKIATALQMGKCIILDRFWWSTMIYGRISGVDGGMLDSLIAIEKRVWNESRPYAVFLLRRELNNSDAVNHRQAFEYKQLAEEESLHYPVFCIDNRSIDSSLQEILQKLHRLKG